MSKKASRSLISSYDLHLFNEGSHTKIYEKMGAHVTDDGCHFSVWAPNAHMVFVFGDFNDWQKHSMPMVRKDQSGIWEAFVPGAKVGQSYKYHIESKYMAYKVDKADPIGFMHETPPKTASVIRNLDYEWGDADWMAKRAQADYLRQPVSAYEVHAGSWRWTGGEDSRPLGYEELGRQLAEYCTRMSYTHVELLPVMEHPYGLSWGYQCTGFFAPTSRFGTPQDFMRMVDILHQADIGVILDWVPSHFPEDEHGLKFFDGTHLYEHADPRQGFHPDWKSAIFNYGRNEVRSFLLSSANFWLDVMHCDGLRVDAVASLLYLNFSREEGEWIPNEYGGNENLAAVSLLRRLNSDVYGNYPGVMTIAEESTAWPMVSRPTYLGGLGFGYKWDMGWMHDTLKYFGLDPIHRRYHHNKLTFRGLYAYSENYVLALSHDEVVHGKRSMIDKMPGDLWRQFANLRLLYAYQYAQPGKKLLFMGGEFGQRSEWYSEVSLDWQLLEFPEHRGLQDWVADLNALYKSNPAMHRLDCDPSGFSWIDCNDWDNSVLALMRYDGRGAKVAAVFNFTPIVRRGYLVGVDQGGQWREVLNSDAKCYGGSDVGNGGMVTAHEGEVHGRPYHLSLTLPPLGALFFEPVED